MGRDPSKEKLIITPEEFEEEKLHPIEKRERRKYKDQRVEYWFSVWGVMGVEDCDNVGEALNCAFMNLHLKGYRALKVQAKRDKKIILTEKEIGKQYEKFRYIRVRWMPGVKKIYKS